MKMSWRKLFAFLLSFRVLSAAAAQDELMLGSLFTDNMVLQRGVEVPVWGWARPGEKITVQFLGQEAAAVASGDGKWTAKLSGLSAGGPYEMVIKGKKKKILLKNILVGEVWLASGQSNMGLSLLDTDRGSEEAKQADFPLIRLCGVPQIYASRPADTIKDTKWVECSSSTAGGFSAAAYYFARGLFRDIKVPVGIIRSSWGGTRIEPWIPSEDLRSLKIYDRELDRVCMETFSMDELLKRYDKEKKAWDAAIDQDDLGNKGYGLGYAKPEYAAPGWQSMKLPTFWEDTGLDIDGAVWFRKEVSVPEAWAGKDLMLSLGVVDDFDTTYFNGQQVGATGRETPKYWIAPRNYTVPGALVKAGRNLIAVRVFDHYNKGGIIGPVLQLFLDKETPVRLEGDWKYKVEYELDRPYLRMEAPVLAPQNILSYDYNGMINPLAPFAIKGFLWYQGESNSGKHAEYRTLFPMMINAWRRKWGNEKLPFIFVQIANYGKIAAEPQQSVWGWNGIRESQLKTLGVNDTAMAVTIDIGDINDVHPKNKKDVGERMLLAALHLAYGRDIVYSGPIYDSMKAEGSAIRVSFKHTGSGLAAKGAAELKGFTIAGADRKFYWADAKIDGSEIVVSSPKVKNPAAVRYAWAESPVCNLYNKENLPASPFRTDEW